MSDHITAALEELTAWVITIPPSFSGRENRTIEQKAASAAAAIDSQTQPRCSTLALGDD